jgi:CRP-like cAMP-binding protein
MDNAHPTGADLATVPLLSGLPAEAREVLARRFQVEEFDTGRRLVTEGRPGYTFSVIASGEVAVQHEDTDVRHLGPGDHIGEIAILGQGRRTATVVALEPVVAWTLFGTEFRALQTERPDVAAALEDAMARRLAADAAAEG